ncbi:MAG: CRISPR-associated protein Csm5 family [Bryobacterales bacterium]|nr:CRISPR-associated protein Csm5 family [Bryobacterales bacterium]
MKYTVTCLTPTLVGDGHKLSPIDYMVWKDQVNVLDQTRIFRLLSKGPRLEGYLTQLKRATKLDFASWGGFAQNFAGRRIPFESAAYSEYWNRAQIESLSIPTFAEGALGPYLPATSIKGALRTGMLSGAIKDNTVAELVQRFQGDRPPRHPGEVLEDQLIGTRTRYFAASDSRPAPVSAFKIYLLRTSTLQQQAPGSYKLGWKQSPRGAVDGKRPEDSTPAFAEMASPGSAFEGTWNEKHFFDMPEVRRILRWSQPVTRENVFAAANQYAAKQLDIHKSYAEWTGLPLLLKQVERLQSKLAQARENGTCVLSIGWGGGFPSKSVLDPATPEARKILEKQPLYQRAIQSGLPFPKTRRIVFLDNQPASLPGWVELAVS